MKKLKNIVQINPEPARGKLVDPTDPWAIKANLAEDSMLNRYLLSRGINPKFVSRDTKISHAKSLQFQKWKMNHQNEEVQVDETITTQHSPYELRQHALKKAQHMHKVKPSGIVANGLHKEETDKTDTITVDIPLMIRLLEYAREDAKTDMDLHSVTERLIEIRGKGMLTMADYDYVVTGKHKVKEDVEQLDELSPSTLASYVLKTTSRDPKRVEPRKKATSKLAKAMAKQPADPNAPKYSTKLFGEGFDDHEEIAKELIRRHGMNVTKDHVKAIENERDSRAALDHEAVMAKVRAMGAMTEAKKPTALEKFRKAATEREKKHADIEKERQSAATQGKEDMKGAIDRLEKHLNKEEVDGNWLHPNKVTVRIRKSASKVKEDVYHDTYAATQMPFDGGNNTDDTSMKKREMSKSARIIKSIYKRKNMKEETYDWEKDDKAQQPSLGKKPKIEKTDEKESYGENKPEARVIMSGGKTMTGETRDTVEIDPSMKNRPGPDAFEKNGKKSPNP